MVLFKTSFEEHCLWVHLHIQLLCLKYFLTLILFSLLWNKPILWLANLNKQWEIRQASVALLVFIVILSSLLPFHFFCSGCAVVEGGRATAVGFTVRPSSLSWDVFLQVSVPVSLSQLGDRAQAVEDVVLGCGLVVGASLTLLGPTKPKVIQLGVDALLWGGLIAVGVQAVEDGAALWGEHIKGHGTLVQAQLPPLHAPDGGSPLQLVVDLNAHTSTCFPELCSHICFPLCCVSLDSSNLDIANQYISYAYVIPKIILQQNKVFF